MNYPALPNKIPTHFGLNGQPDDYGPKTFVFLLPAIVTFVVLLLHFTSRYPHRFNYLKPVTAANAKMQYSMALKLISYLQFIIPFLFFYLCIEIVRGSRSGHASLSAAFMTILFAAIFIPTAISVYQSIRKVPR